MPIKPLPFKAKQANLQLIVLELKYCSSCFFNDFKEIFRHLIKSTYAIFY